jgi:hypothetical protein
MNVSEVAAGNRKVRAKARLLAPAAAIAPPVAYAASYRLDLGVAVLSGVVASVVGLAAERYLTGHNRWSLLGAGGIALSAALVLVTGNARLFFLRSVVLGGIWGVVFVASALVRRPIVGTLSGWLMSPVLAQRQEASHRQAFAFVTLLWGVVELLKAAVRGYAMVTGSLDRLTVVVVATGYPIEVCLAAFTAWYLHRAGVTLREEAASGDGS